MKNLLLLLLAVYFYSNPVAAAAAKSKLHLHVKYSECPGSDIWVYALTPRRWFFVTTDKTTNVIVGLVESEYSGGSGYEWELEPAVLKTFTRRDPKKELHLVVFVQAHTSPKDNLDGIDHQIFYGYDAKVAWLKDPMLRQREIRVRRDLDRLPFRYGELVFTLKHANGKEEKIFEAKEKGCNHDNYEAWIANHGIYRVQKDDKGELHFSNLYYWPRVGMTFT